MIEDESRIDLPITNDDVIFPDRATVEDVVEELEKLFERRGIPSYMVSLVYREDNGRLQAMDTMRGSKIDLAKLAVGLANLATKQLSL